MTEHQKRDVGAEISKLKQEVNQGLRIAALVDDELVKKTLDGLLHGLQNQWVGEPDQKAREALWQRATGLLEFINALKALIDTGKMANVQLQQLGAAENDQDD